MSGRGVLPLQPASVDCGVQLYGNDGQWRIAVEPLDDPDGQVDAVSVDDQAGVGPGLSFASVLQDRSPGGPIGLIPCAKGGSGMVQWAEAEGRDTLYGSCLARVREASSRGRPAALFWYQGETDAKTEADAALWPDRFVAMAQAFRRDLGEPRLPIVVVALADRPDPAVWPTPFPGWSAVQDAQTALPGRLACVAVVSAAGLPHNADTLHLTAGAQSRLGEAAAAALDALAADPSCMTDFS